jgi:hypothetical protein
MMGFQALLEVNLRLATIDHLSNGYDGLSVGVTLPVLLSNTVTFLLAREVTYSITCCCFRCNRA